MSHELAIANQLLDSKITDAEFDKAVERHKLLHDCKTKGFSRLKALGRLEGGIDIPVKKAVREHTTLEFATEAARMVNDGMTMTAACDLFGRNHGDLKYYCDKFGIEYKSKFAKRQWDYDATYKRILHYINRQGYRLKDAAKKIDCTPKLVMDILKSKGRTYNAQAIRIERIKKL